MTQAANRSRAAKYFELLGLPVDAGEQEIESRYQELSAHLASGDLPPTLEKWAKAQAAQVDEAYAVLSDPDVRAGLEVDSVEEDYGIAAEDAVAPIDAKPAVRPVRRGRSTRRLTPWLPLLALAFGIMIGGAALLAVVVAEMGFGGGESDSLAADAESDPFVPVDTERVAALISSYQEDPTNPETLFELGEAYFLAGEWAQGQEWFEKLVEIEPDNVHAWTDIGTSHYNLGRAQEALEAWQTALGLAPDDPQLHYNMGFLYANIEPPDLDAATREWQLVLELAPGTQLAETVQVHLEGLPSGEALGGTSGLESTPAP